MEDSTEKTNHHYGATTVAFGDALLSKISKLSKKFTGGNTSEFLRVIAADAVEKIESGELELVKGETHVIEKK